MYKDLIRNKVRFNFKGSLTLEQLWDLSINELDTLAVSLNDAYENSKGKSFIEKRTTKDKNLKSQLDVVLDILQTKVEELEASKEKAARKERNQKILSLIALKEDEELAKKSKKELQALLEED